MGAASDGHFKGSWHPPGFANVADCGFHLLVACHWAAKKAHLLIAHEARQVEEGGRIHNPCKHKPLWAGFNYASAAGH